MVSEPIKIWLRKKRRKEMAVSGFLSVLSLLSGLVLLFLTFWFAYGIIWVITSGVSATSELFISRSVFLPHGWRLALSGAFIVLLFIGSARTSREYLGSYPRDDYPVSPATLGGGLALVWLLSHSEASSKMICDLLYTGPRLIAGAWNLVRRIILLKNINENCCGEVLSRIIASDRSISKSELEFELSDSQWFSAARDLRLFDGVLFLDKNPVRLSLSDDLRGELRAIAGN